MIQILDKVFHLTNGKFSYAFYVKNGKLVHSYFGKALIVTERTLSNSAVAFGLKDNTGRDCECFEYSELGGGDYRVPAIVVRNGKCISTDFVYSSHEVLKTKPDFGMPALRNGGQTLKVSLRDDLLKLELYLYYTVFDNGLARRAELKNLGSDSVVIDRLMSACIEFPAHGYDIIDLNGRWGRECNVSRNPAGCGIKTFASGRGVTSHQHNPFVAVVDGDATEHFGDAFGMNLIYSGNFDIQCETDEKNRLRVNIGVNIAADGITLNGGCAFGSPEVAIVYSDEGIGGMSREFHKLYRKNLLNPKFADKRRPVVVNSWESMYFDLSEAKFLDFIEGAKGMGIDTIVLDDGWFGKRDSDNSSLGDWFIDKAKFPNGLKKIIDCCKKNGMDFGIWFEPEAINPESKLFKAHPDWALGVDGRERRQMRNQYVLDFSRAEVVDCIFKQMKAILDEYDISYVKWDMNRPLSDVISAEKYIKFVSGVYELYERLNKEYPDLIIEGCSSGGGRFDPAILYYSPFIWTSDDTDAYERAHIQYGTSLCYPLQTLSNHVSVCPNHQTGRTIPLCTRGAVASLGSLGYELNLGKLSEEEREEIRRQIAAYKADAELILTGDLYRLLNPFETGGKFCEEIVSPDKSRAYVVYLRGLNECNMPLPPLRLRGLDETAVYTVKEKNLTLTGGDLMYGGIDLDVYGKDFGSEILHIERIA